MTSVVRWDSKDSLRLPSMRIGPKSSWAKDSKKTLANSLIWPLSQDTKFHCSSDWRTLPLLHRRSRRKQERPFKAPGGRCQTPRTALARELPFDSGHAGLCFHAEEGLGVLRAIRPLCMRYPGLDIPDMAMACLDIGTLVRGVHWLNFLGPRVLRELGGVEGLRSRLSSPGTAVEKLGEERAAVTLSEWPEAGDTEQGARYPSTASWRACWNLGSTTGRPPSTISPKRTPGAGSTAFSIEPPPSRWTSETTAPNPQLSEVPLTSLRSILRTTRSTSYKMRFE